MSVIINIIKKEFLQLKKDKKMFGISIIAPILQLLLLGYAANIDIKNIPLAIYDLDKTAISKNYIDKIISSAYFKKTASVNNTFEIDYFLDTGRANIVIIIPEGFEKNITNGKKTEIAAIIDGSDSNIAAIGSNYLAIITTNFSNDIMLQRIRKIKKLKLNLQTIDPQIRIWYNPDLKSRYFMVPGVLGMLLMLITIVLTSLAIVKEKEIGTLEQLIVTPIKPYQLILGKLIPFTIIGTIDIILILLVAFFVFTIPIKGNIFLLFFLSFIFLLSTLGLGLFISTIANTQQQAMLISIFFVIMPMVYLSGFVFPIENMPKLIQLVTYLMPLRYYLIIVRGIFLKGIGLKELIDETIILAMLGITILFFATKKFKKRIS